MSLDKVKEEIKRKMSFSDTVKPTNSENFEIKNNEEISLKTVKQEDVKTVSLSKKKKVTYYLTEKENKKFEEIYARRLTSGNKTDRSSLICEAIRLLYRNENLNSLMD